MATENLEMASEMKHAAAHDISANVYRGNYKWHDRPENDGSFFYTGHLPGTEKGILIIAHVTTNPSTGERSAYALIPPYWCGEVERTTPQFWGGKLEEWTGQWAGPPHGLRCAYYSSNA